MTTVIIDDYNYRDLSPEDIIKASRLRVRVKDFRRIDMSILERNLNIRSLNVSRLENLDLHFIEFHASIARIIDANPGLHSIRLSYVTGEIILALGKLTNLRKLSVGMVGSFGKELGILVQKSRTLKHFAVSHVLMHTQTLYHAIALNQSITHLTLPRFGDRLRVILKHNVYITHVTIREGNCNSQKIQDLITRYPHIKFKSRSLSTLKVEEEYGLEDCMKCKHMLIGKYEEPPPFMTVIPLPRLKSIHIKRLDDESIPVFIQIIDLNPQIVDVRVDHMFRRLDVRDFIASLGNVTKLTIPRFSDLGPMLHGHPMLQSLNLIGQLDNDYNYDVLELVQKIPCLYHFKTDHCRHNGAKAKHYCQLRKQNHKAYNATLVGLLLPKFY